MSKTILELLVGDLEEKKEYRQLMKRVNALPDDYRFAFKKMQSYLYTVGGVCGARGEPALFTDLVELFEANAAAGAPVLEVTGEDLAGFCDELAAAWSTAGTTREKLNEEIRAYFEREGR